MLKKAISIGLETISKTVTVTVSALRRGDVSPASWLRRGRHGRIWLRAVIYETPAAVWDLSYDRSPPWEIARPQPAYVAVAEKGDIRGRVLDVGCGTGEFALFLRKRGNDVMGIDVSPRAIASARAKARTQKLDEAMFRVSDVFAFDVLDRTFDTVIDSALFHCFSGPVRARYAQSLASILRPGGSLLILAISDREPSDWGGPNRIAQADFAQAFGRGWRVAYIRPATYETNLERHAVGGGAEAWLARIDRVDENND